MRVYVLVGHCAVLALLVAGTTVGGVAPAGATTPGVRYASPTGQDSATCPKQAPCGIITAINAAPTGSQIVVEPGTYGSPTPLTATLEDSPSRTNLSIHGEAGKPMPVIDTVGNQQVGVELENESRISDVSIDFSGAPQQQDGVALYVMNGSADHMKVLATTGVYNGACDVLTVLSDSLCVSTAVQGAAIEPTTINDFSLVLRGDTAQATDPSGSGLLLGGNTGSPDQVVTVTNSIIHGEGADIADLSRPNNEPITVTVTATHSDLATHYPTTLPGSDSITTDGTDLTAPPVFINPAANNFAERASSPTVNAGAADPAGDTDLAGRPRTLGRAPDIGAYELPQKPVTGKPKEATKTATSTTFTVKVNPEGLVTTVHLVAVRGHQSTTSTTSSAGRRITAKKLRLTVHGLRQHTTYHVYAVAKSSAGTTTTKRVTVTTKK